MTSTVSIGGVVRRGMLCLWALLSAALAAAAVRGGAADPWAGDGWRATLPVMTYPPARATRLDLRGTPLAPEAWGTARIWAAGGLFHIDARVERLAAAASYTPGFMTYVLWAVSPDGKVGNLGEFVLSGRGARLHASTLMSAFGLMVTAEPYFAVREPSEAVVLENAVRPDALGRAIQLRSGIGMAAGLGPVGRRASPAQTKVHPELNQARGALWIAYRAGAPERSRASYQSASRLLYEAERWHEGGDRRRAQMTAREAVQGFEDSRSEALAVRENERVLIAHRLEADRHEAAAEALRDAVAQRREADRERAALCARIRDQFNSILAARDAPGGLVLSMPDASFETGRSRLSAAAEEQLARVAGIVQMHSGLGLQVEGHTDAVGPEDYNQELSVARAEEVRGLLEEQGVPPAALSARGFGAGRPLASNETKEGRRQNRRVEIVVSGGPFD